MKRFMAMALVVASSVSAASAQFIGYSVSDNDGHLYQFDRSTGAAQGLGLVNGYNPADEIEGLGLRGKKLNAASEANYRVVDLSSGDLTLVSRLGLGPGGMGFDSGASFAPNTSILYGLREDGQIYTIDPITGTATFQATINISGAAIADNFEGLAVAVPEPTALSLIAVAASLSCIASSALIEKSSSGNMF